MHIFDFDGTIVDCWHRYYNVFVLANNLETSIIDFLDYKKVKLELEKDELVAKYFDIELSKNYFENKHVLIESIDYLKLDSLIVNKEKLIRFFETNDSIILTKRNNINNFYEQLNILGMADLKDKSYIVTGNESKFDFFISKFSNSSNCVYGDSFEEFNFSESINNKVYMVKSGLRDVSKFKYKENVYIIDNINEIINNI
jgi:hypothetical protein